MYEFILKFIDPELLMIIGISIFVFIILKIIYKKITMPVIVKRLTTIVCVVGIVLITFSYFGKIDMQVLDSQTNNYIVGEVDFISSTINRVNVNYINSNIKNSSKGKLSVKVKNDTKIYIKEGNISKLVKIKELQVGDIITIYCKENSISSDRPEVTAKKIMKRDI